MQGLRTSSISHWEGVRANSLSTEREKGISTATYHITAWPDPIDLFLAKYFAPDATPGRGGQPGRESHGNNVTREDIVVSALKDKKFKKTI
jgi:hypothetical protein